MILLLLVLFSGSFILEVTSQDRNITLTDKDTTVTWTPKVAETISVEAEEGYQIKLDVLYLNIDGDNDNYVSITTVDKTTNELNELVFTYVLPEKTSYFFNDNKLLGKYVGSSPINNFSIQFTREGEALTTTTTETTSTTEFLPTPNVKEKSTITVYLYGKSAREYDDAFRKNLIQKLTDMAQDYCSLQACPLNGTISTNNINIQNLQKCSVLWESYDICVSLTFGIPVNILEDYEDEPLWNNYQLSEGHLRIMWNTHGDLYMNHLDLNLYPEPNVERIFKQKLIIFSFVIVFFVTIILILRHYSDKINKKRSKQNSSGMIQSSEYVENSSQVSLAPHYLQDLPPLFSNDFLLHQKQNNYSSNFGEFNETYTDEFNESDYKTQIIINGKNSINDEEDA